jgi:predicted Zn-dependent protease
MDSAPVLLQAALQGSIDLANGRPSDARAQFQQALARKDPSPTKVDAQLGLAETAITEGDAAAAVREARGALQTAATLQGGLPYSCRTGLAWLMLGRAFQQLGDRGEAGKAFATAIAHLSNTVDADHPGLLQARELSRTL